MQHAGATIVVVGQGRAAAALTLVVHPLDNAQVGHVVLLKLRQLAHELRVGLSELQPSAQRSSRPRRPTDTLALKVGSLLLQLGKFLLAAHGAWSGLAAAASARRCVPACSLRKHTTVCLRQPGAFLSFLPDLLAVVVAPDFLPLSR